MTQTLFERLGGMEAIRRLAASFYDKVNASPALARHFEGVDMMSLIEHQAIFIAGATGGPFGFDDATLWHAHARLRIGRAEFDEVVEHLRRALHETGAAEDEIDQVVRAVQAKVPMIVADAGGTNAR